MATLGLVDAAGVVTGDNGPEIGIAGTWTAPDFLDLLGPTVLVPTDAAQPGSITIAVVVADRPEHVADLARTVKALISAPDPGSVTVKTSAELASLRSAVDGRLGEFGAQLLIVTFAATATLIATMLSGLVLMRRKDFGRRRALGATRGFIVGLLTVQTAAAAVVGVLLGSAASTASFAMSGASGPDASFVAGVGILMIAVATLASLPPAMVAAHREPIRELRVP